MMENALYGGRVSNVFDMRVVRAYLTFYFSDEMLAGHREIPTVRASIPQSASHGEYLSFIGRLPDTDAPALFGLPANIERSAQRANASRIIKDLKRLARSGDGVAAFDREAWRAQLSPVLEAWDATAKSISGLASPKHGRASEGKRGEAKDGESKDGSAEGKTPGTGGSVGADGPVASFVEMELKGAERLLAMVAADLAAVKSVLFGSALLTPAVSLTAQCLIDSAVPGRWDRAWEGPDAPLAYIRAVAAKKDALGRWQDRSVAGRLLSKPLDLSDLLHPGTFLNALRQETSRAAGAPLDSLKLVSAWEKQRLSAPLKVCVRGLLLQGAVFDGRTLEEAGVNDLELTEAPEVYIGFVPEDSAEPYGEAGTYAAPVYYDTSRERLLTELSLPIRGGRDKWTLAGVALFLAS
jgi:dynein heavy chain 2